MNLFSKVPMDAGLLDLHTTPTIDPLVHFAPSVIFSSRSWSYRKWISVSSTEFNFNFPPQPQGEWPCARGWCIPVDAMILMRFLWRLP